MPDSRPNWPGEGRVQLVHWRERMEIENLTAL